MAENNKIFNESDFEKPKDKNFWQKYKGWTIGIIALLIVVLLCCIFCGNDEIAEQELTEQIAQGSDTIVSDKTDTIEIPEFQETETTSSRVADLQKQEVTQDVVMPSKSVQVINVSNDVETEALKVIRGDYGIGQERKDKLGEKYQTIQTRVNELKREGLF